jgi:type II secretion system protein J
VTRARSQPRRAFTLPELIVGVVIASMIAGGTAAAVSRIVKSRQEATARRQAFARATAAVERIARDAWQVARDAELAFAKVRVVPALRGGSSELLLLVRSGEAVRGEGETSSGAEGDEREVAFRVRADPASGKTYLWRRADVGLDGAVDGGGVASAIVGGVTSLRVEALERDAWRDGWDSDESGLPWALRVTVTAKDESGLREATARKVIALDRVPLAPRDEDSASPTRGTPSGGSDSANSGGSGS